ncbi:MAG: inositol monophosphatase family protein [Opitutales bacterium]
MDTKALPAFIEELTRETAEVIRPFWDQDNLAVDTKSDDSPVTAADHKAEEVLRARIAERFPEHGFIGEEFGNERLDAEYVWILDPIDGTKSFITHVPLFGTLIGLLRRGEPIFGAIHQPILGQLLMGDNTQATLNGKPVRVREARPLKECVLLASAIHPEGIELPDPAAWQRLLEAVSFSRTWGDCYGYLLVASGQADIMADPQLSPWDILPIVPIIRGAGGIITDWEGQRIARGPNPLEDCADSAVAAPPHLHRQVLDLLNS